MHVSSLCQAIGGIIVCLPLRDLDSEQSRYANGADEVTGMGSRGKEAEMGAGKVDHVNYYLQ